ncbi:MAG: cyclic nucleotide-binding domain-containing protein [Deltaproteobacteria bacterium]|nr:cyclic nucleotide-binding domain-containing protein [Deltaproteobacteria bacterium]
MSDRAKALAGINIFSGLGEPALEQLASIASEEAHKLGGFVFHEGSPGDGLYLILSGKVRISREVAGMGEEALAILQAGETFGEMSIIDGSPRSADARVHESCMLLVIKKADMEDLLFLHKDLAYEILWSWVRTLSSRLRETNDKMTFLSVSGKF